MDHLNVQSESVWGCDGVRDRLLSQMERRAGSELSGYFEAVQPSPSILVRPASASPAFPARLKLPGGDSAVGLFGFAFLFFPSRCPSASRLHRCPKLLLMSSFEMDMAVNAIRTCWQRLLSRMQPAHLEWSGEAAVEGLKEIEQCCCAFSSRAGISHKTLPELKPV